MTPFLNNCRHFDNQTKRKEEDTKQKATKNQLEKSKVVSKNSLLNNIWKKYANLFIKVCAKYIKTCKAFKR